MHAFTLAKFYDKNFKKIFVTHNQTEIIIDLTQLNIFKYSKIIFCYL